tara:strand:+ start:110 stop:532 length:423 start_codon:yes stop_codon:yes gene_type:complete
MEESYFLLFLSAFLAATIIPISSEVMLMGFVSATDKDAWSFFLVASAGNVLGAIINWVLGRFCINWQKFKWFPVSKVRLHKVNKWFNRFGVWSLLLAWVPVIGDALTVAAGFFRVRFWLFLILVSVSKAGRYAVLLLLFR